MNGKTFFIAGVLALVVALILDNPWVVVGAVLMAGALYVADGWRSVCAGPGGKGAMIKGLFLSIVTVLCGLAALIVVGFGIGVANGVPLASLFGFFDLWFFQVVGGFLILIALVIVAWQTNSKALGFIVCVATGLLSLWAGTGMGPDGRQFSVFFAVIMFAVAVGVAVGL